MLCWWKNLSKHLQWCQNVPKNSGTGYSGYTTYVHHFFYQQYLNDSSSLFRESCCWNFLTQWIVTIESEDSFVWDAAWADPNWNRTGIPVGLEDEFTWDAWRYFGFTGFSSVCLSNLSVYVILKSTRILNRIAYIKEIPSWMRSISWSPLSWQFPFINLVDLKTFDFLLDFPICTAKCIQDTSPVSSTFHLIRRVAF